MINSKSFREQWLSYAIGYEVDEKFKCPKCDTDKHVSFDLYHTEDDTPYDGAHCEKCGTIIWTEDIL